MFEINPFVLQVIISNVPTVLTNGFIPILGSSFGTSLVSLGFFFFLNRLGSVIGSTFSPKLHNKYAPHKIGVGAEVLFFLTTNLILFAVIIKSPLLFVLSAFFKGVISGTISILRFSWLKKLPDFHQSSRLNLVANVLIQGSYCLVGLFLFLEHSITMAKTILIIDGIGSLFGAYIFWKMKKYSSIPDRTERNKYKEMFFSLVSTPARRALFLTDILVCAGLGGTNLMLFKYGESFFGKNNGYAIALILYGVFYFVGGKIIQVKNKGKGISLDVSLVIISLFMMILSLLLLPIFDWLFIKIIFFSLIFFFYPLVCLQIQSEWFKICKTEEAASISSAILIYSQFILGIFEVIYGYFEYDNIARAIFLLVCLFMVFLYLFLRNFEVNEFVQKNEKLVKFEKRGLL